MMDDRRAEYIARRLTDRVVMAGRLERYVRPAPRPLAVQVVNVKRWLLTYRPIRAANNLRHRIFDR